MQNKYEIDVLFKMNKYGVTTTQNVSVTTDQTADEFMVDFEEQAEYEVLGFEVLSCDEIV